MRQQDARNPNTVPAPAVARPDKTENGARGAPSRASRPTVLILGAYRQALAVARSLNAAGMRVLLGRADGRESPFERSRAIDGIWEHPSVKRQQAFATALETLCRSGAAPDYLFPLGDEELALVAALAPLGLPVTVVAVTPDVLERCQDKAQTLAAAAAQGVAFARCEPATSAQQVRDVAARIGFPLVLKAQLPGDPDGGVSATFIGGKALMLSSAAELDAVLHERPVPPAGVLVQREACGPRHNIYFAAWQGELRAHADTVTLRTDRHDGTGLAVEGMSVEPLPHLVEQTARLVRELGYTGVGCAQFLVDPRDGSTCFLEINARLGANCAAVIAAGLDLPKLFFDLMHGDIPLQGPARTGLHFAWFGGDLNGLLDCRRSGSIGRRESLRWLLRMVFTQFVADTHVTFQWRDPLPTTLLLLRRFATATANVLSSSAR